MHEIPGQTQPARRPGQPRESESRCPYVLVVDDDPESREALGALLAQAGLRVALADSVREAIRALDAYSPSVLVSDLVMPVEDGFSLIHTVREREEGSRGRLPAIAVTAIADPSIRRHAVAAGFDACFLKPFAGPAVVNAVAQAVRQRPAAR
jgi:CheY-like chemotaxis protein